MKIQEILDLIEMKRYDKISHNIIDIMANEITNLRNDLQWEIQQSNERVLICNKCFNKFEDQIKELIKYIKALDSELNETQDIAFIHSWRSTRHELGMELRSKLEKLFNKEWKEIMELGNER